MGCGHVASYDRFLSEGCINCEAVLSLQGNGERVMEATTSSFTGLVGVLRREGSWVARWQRIEQKQAGLYAIKVVGRLPEDLEDACRRQNIKPVAVER